MNNPFPTNAQLRREIAAEACGDRAFETALMAAAIARNFLRAAASIDWDGHEPDIGYDWDDVLATMRAVAGINAEQHANAVTERACEAMEGV